MITWFWKIICSPKPHKSLWRVDISWKHVDSVSLLLTVLIIIIIRFKDLLPCLEQRAPSFISSVICLKNNPGPLNNNMHRIGAPMIKKPFKSLRYMDFQILSFPSLFCFFLAHTRVGVTDISHSWKIYFLKQIKTCLCVTVNFRS